MVHQSGKAYLETKALGIRDLINDVAGSEVTLQEMNRQLRSIQGNEGLEVYLPDGDGFGQHAYNPVVGAELARLVGTEDLSAIPSQRDQTRFILSPPGFNAQVPTVIAVIATEPGTLFLFRSRVYVSAVNGWRLTAIFWGWPWLFY